jgi:copper chaperone CopZ
MHCVGKVKDALKEVDGVVEVEVDLKSKTATLKTIKSVTDKILLDKLESIDYIGKVI